MMDTKSETELLTDPTLYVGPMLLVLRRLEKAEIIIDRLAARGVIRPEEMDYAHLKTTLNHAERLIRTRKRTNRPTGDLEEAALTVRKEIEQLEVRLKEAV
jgi:F0F1-type ATP synthase epsilon subunit